MYRKTIKIKPRIYVLYVSQSQRTTKIITRISVIVIAEEPLDALSIEIFSTDHNGKKIAFEKTCNGQMIPTVAQVIGHAAVDRPCHVSLAKYCDKHACVCVSVCRSVCPRGLSPESHARSLPIFLYMLPMAVDRSSSGRVTKSQGGGTVLEVSSSLALYSRVFGTHTKTAELIEMPFGMTTWEGRRYHVLDG